MVLDKHLGVGLRQPFGLSAASEPLEHAEIMRPAPAPFKRLIVSLVYPSQIIVAFETPRQTPLISPKISEAVQLIATIEPNNSLVQNQSYNKFGFRPNCNKLLAKLLEINHSA